MPLPLPRTFGAGYLDRVPEPSPPERNDQAPPDSADERLGRLVHRFEAKVRRPAARRRALEVTGVLAIALVPVGLAWVKGTLGTAVAVLGALVALAAYVLSGRAAARPRVRIELFEGGIACAQGKQRRALAWNEIVEVTCRPVGETGRAIAFEVVGEPPLVIVVGGAMSDVGDPAAMLAALEKVWVPLWCRRARALMEHDRRVRIGPVEACCDGVEVAGRRVPWHEVRLARRDPESEPLDDRATALPFPSTARRLAALAEAPPRALPCAATGEPPDEAPPAMPRPARNPSSTPPAHG
jgi:hypothetical protein